MNFTHYTDNEANIGADLVNSLGSITGTEFLPDPDAVRAFLDEHEITFHGRITQRDVEALRELRKRFRAVFEASTDEEAATRINRLLQGHAARPQITDHDGHPWHLHYTPEGAGVVAHVATTAAMGLAVVMSEFGTERFGICAADECRDVFVDTSRNSSRRYCNDTCSSRMNVAAYRARRKHA
jgi:predicted RNA-binding Zn ribbon-like protein